MFIIKRDIYENEIKRNKMRPTEYRPQQVILSKRDNNNSNETSTIENIERNNEIKSLLAETIQIIILSIIIILLLEKFLLKMNKKMTMLK